MSSTEIDFSKHVPVYKQFDVHGKRVMNVEEDPLVSKHKAVRRKKDEPEYKQNFLAQFFEDAEEHIQKEEQQSAMRDKLAKLKKDQATGAKQPFKSILKKKDAVEAAPIQMPSHMSKAHRAPIQIEGQSQETSPTALTEEQDARLTTSQITEGVQRAREAVNAPSADLLEFEKQLKFKYDEYKAQGIVPKLRTESKTIKPKRLLRPKMMNNK